MFAAGISSGKMGPAKLLGVIGDVVMINGATWQEMHRNAVQSIDRV